MNFNFKDIDFGAIASMLNSMSDEQKEDMARMANDMMQEMRSKNVQPEPEEESTADIFTGLKLSDAYTSLPGKILDQIEAGYELEDFYSEVTDADFSACALFYIKAVLNALRQAINPELLDKPASAASIQDYLILLSDPRIQQQLEVQRQNGEKAAWLAAQLGQLSLFLNRAEYDSISKSDLEFLKTLIFDQDLLLTISNYA